MKLAASSESDGSKIIEVGGEALLIEPPWTTTGLRVYRHMARRRVHHRRKKERGLISREFVLWWRKAVDYKERVHLALERAFMRYIGCKVFSRRREEGERDVLKSLEEQEKREEIRVNSQIVVELPLYDL
jgi:hypothetical protein